MSGSIACFRKVDRFLTHPAVMVLAVAVLLSYATSRGEGDHEPRSTAATGYPPIITVTKPQPDSTTRHSQTTEIRFDYASDPSCFEPIEPDQPDPCAPADSTLQVWVNDVEETAEFTKHGGWANTTSVTMPDTLWSTIRGKICNEFGCDEDTTWVFINTKPAPEVSLLATDDQVRDRGLCATFPAGPAASWACDEFLITHSTVPYYSLGKARGITLVYSSELAEPQELIHANVEFPWESTVPDYLGVRLKRDQTWVDPEIYLSTDGISTADSGDVRRVTLTLKLDGVGPGLHDLTFMASSYYSGSSKDGDDVMVFAHDTVVATKISRGWAILGLARVQRAGWGNSDLIWSDGAGTTHYYLDNASSYNLIDGVLASMDTVIPPTSDKTWKRTLPDGTTEYYNSSGQLKRIEGVNPADVTTFHYSGALIDSILDATGQKIEFDYDGATGLLANIIYPGDTATARDSTHLEYDGYGRLDKIYDPDGPYTQFTYSGTTNRITERRDRSGATTEYEWYDPDYTRRVERVVLPTGDDTLAYAAPQLAALPDTTNGALSPSTPDSTPPRRNEVGGSITNPRGYSSTFKVNEFGSLLEWVDALNRKTTYERANNSLVTKRIDPDSSEFTFGRVLGLGLLWTTNDVTTDSVHYWVYPGGGSPCPAQKYPCHPLKYVRYRGYGNPKDSTSYTYTGNRLLTVTHPGGGTTSYSYQGEFSQLDTVTDPLGHKQRFEYDSNTGYLVRRFTEWGDTVTFQADTVTYWYDGKGRKIRETVDQAGGNYPYGKVFTEYEYDQLNRITKIHRVEGKYSGRFGYSELQRHTVTYVYDDTARALTVSDPKGQSQRLTYNALGLVAEREDPAGESETFYYDEAGNLDSLSTRRGHTIAYEYDALDRLIKKKLPSGDSVIYGYHTLRGTLDTIITPDAKNYREFDSRGRIVLDSSWVAGVSGEGRAVRYTYDAQGNLETLTDPWGDTYTYDPTAEPRTFCRRFRYRGKTWVNAFGDTTSWYYDEDGLLAKIDYGNGVQDTVIRDSSHLITQFGDVTYQRDARGNRIGQIIAPDSAGSRLVKYQYDFKNQLSQEWDSIPGQPPVTRAFEYDSAGNRSGVGYVYDQANRLLATPTDTFRYNASGSLEWWKVKGSNDSTTLTWDPEERLTEVKLYQSGGQTAYRTVSFTYDGAGRRVKKVVVGDQSDTLRFVWYGDEILAELAGTGAWTRRYTPHPTNLNRMIAVRLSEDSVFFLHHDKQGSVVSVTDTSGDTLTRYRYDAFGANAVVGAEGFVGSLLWQGQQRDWETGLYYFRARYYSAELGRFISEDPIGIGGGLNPYLFPGNDPVNETDPWGLCQPNCAVAYAAGGAVVGSVVGAIAIGAAATASTGGAGTFVGGIGGKEAGAFLGAAVGGAIGSFLDNGGVDALRDIGSGIQNLRIPSWLEWTIRVGSFVLGIELTPPVLEPTAEADKDKTEQVEGGGGDDGDDDDEGGDNGGQ